MMAIDPTLPGRSINRNLQLFLQQDGLFDILAGLIIITFGVIPLLDESGMGVGLRQIIFLVFYGIEVSLFLWLKRRISLPRSGQAVPPGRKRRRLSLILLLLNVAILIFLLANYGFDLIITNLLGQYQLSIMLGMIFLLVLSIVGAMLKAPRYFGYSILVFACFVGSEYLFYNGLSMHHGIPLAAAVSGGIIICVGLLYLLRFIKTYNSESH